LLQPSVLPNPVISKPPTRRTIAPAVAILYAEPHA
jgi:hypothetical protein